MHTIHLLSIPILLVIAAGLLKIRRINPGHILTGINFFIAFQFVVIATMMMFFEPQQSKLVNTNILNLLMLLLVMGIGFIVTKFAKNYMQAEVNASNFWCWLLLTLAAVICVVITNHLVVLLVAWAGISLSLHRLLTFYPERSRASLAAHKKFLLARLAELLLASAIALLYSQHQTFFISQILTHFKNVAMQPELSLTLSEQIAAALLALVALIKCAQLPVHGWLMQVVEAPTPVSALLHAGIINLGGFLLLLFAPLMMQAIVAKWLILLVAGFTTVIAALVMTTRVSIKVRLAWSTTAQMGLMLIECALGLYELALMHLIAHSIYKAHAFLGSGSAVFDTLQAQLAPVKRPSLWQWCVALVLSFALTASTLSITQYQGPFSVWLLIAFALSSLLAERFSENQNSRLWLVMPFAALIMGCYIGFKWLFSHVLVLPASALTSFGSAADVFLSVLLLGLFILSLCLQYAAHNPWIKRLSVSLFAGLYLDEWLTKLTLKVWPTELPNAKVKTPFRSFSQQES
ncbi:NADH-quinone oxidoreductase subunit L [Pseudoalteromonas sp.]|uniref:NADH-quinone oxidoreductase subunit L n=1 Tax=Pseudoalteromonas sp. TaxID=53249 RepID=UPI003563B5ED